MVFVLGGVAVWTVSPAQAQDQQPIRIVLEDGSRLVGSILEETDDALVFRTVSGVEMTLPRDRIKSVESLKGTLESGKYIRYDPNRTRLFFAPTARSQGSGQGYVGLYEIFATYISIGVGNVASLGVGGTLIPGASEQLLYGAAKVTLYERRTMAFAAGAFVASTSEMRNAGGFLLGVGTFGPPNRSLTIGLGFGFGNSDFEETPVLLVGGEMQLSNHIKLITENYIMTSVAEGVLVSGGIRFFGERLAADFALATVPAVVEDLNGFPFVPWIGFSYNFGWGRVR